MPEPHIGLRLDTEDRALLDACSKAEKLNKSDIIRRALREYAKKLGVVPEPRRSRRNK